MAIPTAFTPVQYDTLLLIDGGWTRNLPVQEAQEMGADIIISIDVGAPLKKKEELNSMISILDQTAWLLSAQDTEKQTKNSDYLVKPKVSSFSTFDFESADTIINLGYMAAKEQSEQFIALANRVYPEGRATREVIKPQANRTFNIKSIKVHGTHLTSDKFVEGRLGLTRKDSISIEEIQKEIGLLYGSMYYKKVSFQIIPGQDSTGQELHVFVVEDNPAKLKMSFYYDTENSLGINLNLTLRNLLLPNSRLIFDGFISESPILVLNT